MRVCKTSALPPNRCDVTPLQVCSTILGSHIMKRECQVLSPLPRAVSPTFPNQSEPLHYWCQVSVSRTRYIIQTRRHRARCTPFIVITTILSWLTWLTLSPTPTYVCVLIFSYQFWTKVHYSKAGKRCNFCCFAIASFHVCKTELIAMKFICFVNRKKIYEQIGEKYFYKLEKIFQDLKMYQLMINCC